MNISQFISSDQGGAAKAAIRISEAINLNFNNKSKVVVCKKKTYDENICILSNEKFKKVSVAINNIYNKYTIRKYIPKSIFSNALCGINILNEEIIRNSDIVNLHWINGGVLSYKSIDKLKKLNKPIVWTLHDMWAFTGGCHYDQECGKYKASCCKCKVLGSNKSRDLSTKIQKRKLKIYSDMNITIVGCSNWITECARQSSLFKNKLCVNIPNAIDVEKYKPIEKSIAKNILNIKSDKKIILFGAMSSTSDERKGFNYLLEAIQHLDKNKYIAVIFGNDKRNEDIEKYLETIYFGQLSDDYSLSLLYSSADVFVAPSKQENLANTVMESLACGTPVVAFEIGGMKDMIKHNYNGYLANPFNTEDLANGITYCIDDNLNLSKNARDYVLSNFTYEIIGKKYIELYEKLKKQ